MSSFDDRKNAFEHKYANDQETLFKIEARAVKMLGLWAAQEMGKSEADSSAYAADLIGHNLKQPGLQDVTGKVATDLKGAGKSDVAVEQMMLRFLKEAEAQLRAA
jgi:hypothetical protein